MTPEAQRTAIAEACGWTLAANGVWRSPDNSHHDRLPDYLHDLNAMHEAEKTLEPNDQVFFVASLWTVLGLHEPGFEKEARPNDFYFRCLHATAAQRAEAFLRTVGRWSDEETPP